MDQVIIVLGSDVHPDRSQGMGYGDVEERDIEIPCRGIVIVIEFHVIALLPPFREDKGRLHPLLPDTFRGDPRPDGDAVPVREVQCSRTGGGMMENSIQALMGHRGVPDVGIFHRGEWRIVVNIRY